MVCQNLTAKKKSATGPPLPRQVEQVLESVRRSKKSGALLQEVSLAESLGSGCFVSHRASHDSPVGGLPNATAHEDQTYNGRGRRGSGKLCPATLQLRDHLFDGEPAKSVSHFEGCAARSWPAGRQPRKLRSQWHAGAALGLLVRGALRGVLSPDSFSAEIMSEGFINDPARTRRRSNPPCRCARRHEPWQHAVVPTQISLGLPCQQSGPS